MPGQATDERSRPPEPLFHFLRNRCSTSSGFRVPLPGFAVPLPPDSLFHFLRIPCSTSSGIPMMTGAAGEDSAHFPRCGRLAASVSQRCGARRAAIRRAPRARTRCAATPPGLVSRAAGAGRCDAPSTPPGRRASAAGRAAKAPCLPCCRRPASSRGAFAPRELPRLNTVGSEEARPAGAGLRPPLKRYVRFSRIPLSRRRLRVMRTDGGIKEWNPPPARRVQPVGKSPRSLMLGSFTHGTVHLSALAHLTVLSGPDRLRRPPSPTHSVAAP